MGAEFGSATASRKLEAAISTTRVVKNSYHFGKVLHPENFV